MNGLPAASGTGSSSAVPARLPASSPPAASNDAGTGRPGRRRPAAARPAGGSGREPRSRRRTRPRDPASPRASSRRRRPRQETVGGPSGGTGSWNGSSRASPRGEGQRPGETHRHEGQILAAGVHARGRRLAVGGRRPRYRQCSTPRRVAAPPRARRRGCGPSLAATRGRGSREQVVAIQRQRPVHATVGACPCPRRPSSPPLVDAGVERTPRCLRATIAATQEVRCSRSTRSARRPRRCSTTTSTAACGPRRSSTSPASTATTTCRRPTSTSSRPGSGAAPTASRLELYLETFEHTVGVMQDRDAIVRVAAECAEDLAADGVVYAEVRYAPELSTEKGLTLDEVVEANLEGFRLGAERAAAAGHPIVMKRARHRDAPGGAVASRSPSAPSAGATRASSASTSPGPRRATARRRHLDAFDHVRHENFHITIHAGEAFGLPSIWEALQFCGAERLGHGVRIVDDITVRDDGAVHARAGWPRSSATGASRSRCARPRTSTPARAASIADAPDRPAPPAPVPGHGQHRQPADERRLDVVRVRGARRGVRARPGRDGVADDQRA